jgi:hypothetical protein
MKRSICAGQIEQSHILVWHNVKPVVQRSLQQQMMRTKRVLGQQYKELQALK